MYARVQLPGGAQLTVWISFIYSDETAGGQEAIIKKYYIDKQVLFEQCNPTSRLLLKSCTLMRKLSNQEFDSPAKVRDTDWEAVPASLVARHV